MTTAGVIGAAIVAGAALAFAIWLYRLVEAAPEPKETWRVEGALHRGVS